MGERPIRDAVRWVLEEEKADAIISIGFAGGLHPRMCVGDLFRGEFFYGLSPDGTPEESEIYRFSAGSESVSLPDECAAHPVRVLTAPTAYPKKSLALLVRDMPTVVEMETLHVVREVCRKGLPFLSLRAVSDGLDDDIVFDLDALSGAEGKISIPKVLASVVRRPALIRSFYLAWKGAGKAGKRLGEEAAEILKSCDRVGPDRTLGFLHREA